MDWREDRRDDRLDGRRDDWRDDRRDDRRDGRRDDWRDDRRDGRQDDWHEDRRDDRRDGRRDDWRDDSPPTPPSALCSQTLASTTLADAAPSARLPAAAHTPPTAKAPPPRHPLFDRRHEVPPARAAPADP